MRGREINYRRMAVKELEKNGYSLKRNGAKHDIYFNQTTRTMITLKRHDFDKNDYRYIKKEIKQNCIDQNRIARR